MRHSSRSKGAALVGLIAALALGLGAAAASAPAAETPGPIGSSFELGASSSSSTAHSQARPNPTSPLWKRCTNDVLDCSSYDPVLDYKFHFNGDTSDCHFSWDIDWGDGRPITTVHVSGTRVPAVLIVSGHEYQPIGPADDEGRLGSWAIQEANATASDGCTMYFVPSRFTLMDPCSAPGKGKLENLMAAARCYIDEDHEVAKCASEIGQKAFFAQLKIYRTAQDAKGLFDLHQIPKRLQALARAFNSLAGAKILPGAPKGLRTNADLLVAVNRVDTGEDLINLLPNLGKAMGTEDLKRFGRNLAGVAGLSGCLKSIERLVG